MHLGAIFDQTEHSTQLPYIRTRATDEKLASKDSTRVTLLQAYLSVHLHTQQQKPTL